MNRHTLILLVISTVLFSSGCGNGAVPGGTEGKLLSDGNPLGDFKITAYQKESDAFKAIGSSRTKNDGGFKLIKDNSEDNLWLPEGEYVFTVESIGSDVVIPKEYSKPETTLLKVNWNEDEELLLDIPNLKEPN